MKQVMILIAFLFLGFSSAYAQQGDKNHKDHKKEWKKDMSPEERIEMMVKQLDENVDLSDDQETKVRAILEKSSAKIKAISEKYKPQIDAMKAEMKAAKEENKDDREAMKQKWEEVKEKYGEDWRKMKDEMREVKARSKAEISELLSVEQKTKFYKHEEERKRHFKKDHHKSEKNK